MVDQNSSDWWNSPLTPKKLLIILLWIAVVYMLLTLILTFAVTKL